MVKKEPFFSIIIPAYNSEHYLEECLESVMSQTFTNFEVIIINDGSSDSTEEICRRFALNYANLRYFTQENKGPLAARKNGLSSASGEYVLWLDSDDYLNKSALEILYKYILIYNSDMIVFRYYVVDENKKVISIPESKHQIFYNYTSNRDVIAEIVEGYLGVLFCRCTRRTVAQGISMDDFLNTRYGEDVIQSLYLSLNSPRSVFIPEILYFNRINPYSICQNRNVQQIIDSTKSAEIVCNFLEKNKFENPLVINQLERWWKNVLGLLSTNLDLKGQNDELLEAMEYVRHSKCFRKVIENQNAWRIPKMKKIAFKLLEKQYYILLLISLRLYRLIKK